MASPINRNVVDRGPGNTDDSQFDGNIKLSLTKGVQLSAQRSITAAGTTTTDAFVMSAAHNEVTTTALNAGVRFFSFLEGQTKMVFNRGASTLSVYPPTGGEINGLGTNIPLTLASGLRATFHAFADTLIAGVKTA